MTNGELLEWQTTNVEFRMSNLGILSFRFFKIKRSDSIIPTNQTPAPTPEPTCGAGLKKLQVDVLTDNYSEETSWVLVDTCTNQVKDSKNSFTDNTQYSNNWCLPEAQYEFTINDSFGDGICCGFGLGSYSVTWDGSVLVDAGGNFASSETTTFGSCSTPPPTPPPTPSPTTPNPTANVSILTCLLDDTHDMFPFVYTVVSYLRFFSSCIPFSYIFWLTPYLSIAFTAYHCSAHERPNYSSAHTQSN